MLGFGFPATTYMDNLSWNTALVACEGDTNDDGVVDVEDLVAVILAWGTADANADVDGNGIVDVVDLTTVILAWGNC